MVGFGLNMNILVPNKNLCGQKDLSFKSRHKAQASLLTEILTKYEGLIHKKMPKDKF
jgi:hypothetical protein